MQKCCPFCIDWFKGLKVHRLFWVHNFGLCFMSRTSSHYLAMISVFGITTAFHYVFSASYSHGHLIALPFLHWPIAGAARAASPTMIHLRMESVHFSWKHVFPEFLTWLITDFQCSCSFPMERNFPDDKNKALCQWLSIRMLWSQHNVCNCDHSSLMERDPYYLDWSVLHLYELFVWKDVVSNVTLKMGFSWKSSLMERGMIVWECRHEATKQELSPAS
jgi:hypothetical protein